MRVVAIACVLAFAGVRGETVSVAALPESAYADTEVATNIPFNAARSDAREFGVALDFTGTASNCVQVAFGRDADGDGVLSPDETGLALGWRAGCYFIEDAAGGSRFAEAAAASPGDARRLELRVSLNRLRRPRAASVTNEAGACFAPLAASAPAWLYGADWNLLRVTRRGVDAADEAVGVECLYQFFRISIR